MENLPPFDWDAAEKAAKDLTDSDLVYAMRIKANELAAMWRAAEGRDSRLRLNVYTLSDRRAVIVDAFTGRVL